jgi:hypothetical protein
MYAPLDLRFAAIVFLPTAYSNPVESLPIESGEDEDSILQIISANGA